MAIEKGLQYRTLVEFSELSSQISEASFRSSGKAPAPRPMRVPFISREPMTREDAGSLAKFVYFPGWRQYQRPASVSKREPSRGAGNRLNGATSASRRRGRLATPQRHRAAEVPVGGVDAHDADARRAPGESALRSGRGLLAVTDGGWHAPAVRGVLAFRIR
jgi:hypothetical protein